MYHVIGSYDDCNLLVLCLLPEHDCPHCATSEPIAWDAYVLQEEEMRVFVAPSVTL